ncbi:ATP-binding protein [Larkinella bovis]|uniref:histidine kinase n=1 Tax=Larkinella bovis TaxID=683041 RepID=A0ABW0I5K7_9BACT
MAGIWICSLIKANAQAPLNLLPQIQAEKPVTLTCQYLIDSTDHRTIHQVTDPALSWQSSVDPTLILGFTPHPVWCRFTLQPLTSASRTYALELTNFYVDSLTLYQPDSLSGWRIQHSGDLIPFAQRTPATRYPTVYVTLSGTVPQTFFARIQSSQHHSYHWQVWNQATFAAKRLPDFERYILFTLAFILALFQVALLGFMYQYVILRSYALFALAVCLSVLFASGFSGILFPLSPYWVHVSHYATVGLLLPTMAYYVIQAFQLPLYMPRLVWLYVGFGGIGLLYAGLSFFVRHPYITRTLIGSFAIMLGFTMILMFLFFIRRIRPVIWNVLALVFTLPVYTYFYGRNAGFFTGSLKEETLQGLMILCFVSEPFFIVVMLWQATRERIRTMEILAIEKERRTYIQTLDQLKTDFFTNVSHELRTPVTLLLGPLEGLHRRFPDNELYALMYRNASRLQTLIDQLLDLAKLDASQIKNSPTLGNLTEDIRIWVRQFDGLAQSRSISLTLHQNRSNWSGLYDADKVEKILFNLLSNALKYTPAGGAVTVEVLYTKEDVTIEVQDTGIGMEPGVVAHLFDRFYQAEGTGRQKAGTGVGLALTHELIQLLNGTISVTSQLGNGSTFCVYLPMVEQPGLSLNKPGSSPEPVRSASSGALVQKVDNGQEEITGQPELPDREKHTAKPLLLLVEDNEDLRLYIRMILSADYTLLEAEDGQQGLEMALDAVPDLIVTDWMMPQLSGIDLCHALRTDSRTDHIPIVMLTAKTAVEDRLSGLKTGADDYLTKPFLPSELTVRLQNLLRRQASLRTHWQRSLANPPESSERNPSVAETPLFLQQLFPILEQYLDQPDFEVEQLAEALALSSRTLTRKLKALLGLNARETIRNYRLRRADELLQAGMLPTQVADAVGFGSLSSFGRAYKEQFGQAPSERKK